MRLENISYDLHENEILGIVGESGWKVCFILGNHGFVTRSHF
jgi:ABC-type phosphonate transport system ATPase subunit